MVSIQSSSSNPSSVRTSRDVHDTRLTGPWLVRTRVAWGVCAALLLGLFAVQLPAYWTQLGTVCTGADCAITQPSPASAGALRVIGLSVGGYAGLTIAVSLVTLAVSLAVAGVIVWRKSDDWMALLAAEAAVALGTVMSSATLQVGRSPWQLTALIAVGLSDALLFLFAALFPNGRAVPRWALWLPVGWLAAWAIILGVKVVTGGLWWDFYLITWLLLMAGAGTVQIYRYRVASNPRERAQTRWVVLGGVVAVVAIIAVIAPLLVPAMRQPGALLPLLSIPVSAVAISLCVLSVGFAILRSRLYDIDVIIRRTLIYGILTGTLAVIYGVTILAAQAIVQGIWGQQPLPPVVIVASTLLIAALVRPLRARVQTIIDWRFFRRKYDAAKTLDAFRTTLRNEYDVNELRRQLLAVVAETTQPAHVSLWLRWPERDTPPRGSSADETPA